MATTVLTPGDATKLRKEMATADATVTDKVTSLEARVAALETALRRLSGGTATQEVV